MSLSFPKDNSLWKILWMTAVPVTSNWWNGGDCSQNSNGSIRAKGRNMAKCVSNIIYRKSEEEKIGKYTNYYCLNLFYSWVTFWEKEKYVSDEIPDLKCKRISVIHLKLEIKIN